MSANRCTDCVINHHMLAACCCCTIWSCFMREVIPRLLPTLSCPASDQGLAQIMSKQL